VITEPHRKELLSRAYVEIVAACCGMSLSRPDPDYGVDLILHRVAFLTRGADGKRIFVQTGYPLEVQLKSTINAIVGTDEISYDLDAKAYAKLASTNVGCERILVLLALPRDGQPWVAATEDGLHLQGCAYWISLKGRIMEPQKMKVRISIPRANMFSPQALEQIMNRIGNGVEL